MTLMVKNACHRDKGFLKENNKVEYPQNAEFKYAVYAAYNLFLSEKILPNEAEQYGDQNENNLGSTTFKQGPVECQRMTLMRLKF